MQKLLCALLCSGCWIGQVMAQVESSTSSASSLVELTEQSAPIEVFSHLLLEYKKNSECYSKLNKGQNTYDDVDLRFLSKLPAKVAQARFQEYNVPYRLNLRIEQKLSRELRILKTRLDNTPLSDYGKRAQMEINYRAAQDQSKKARHNLCLLSVQANTSMLDAIETLKPDEKKEATQIVKKDPKMPFRVLGNRADRLQKPDSEKPNLTPVDDEFYKTQIGKKLEADLGGRADFWSYDFDKDELYVKVGKEVGKVIVVNQGVGVRFIRTRVGQDFVEPRGSDTKVDLTQAKGKFLTGDANDPSLFGAFPRDPDKPRSEPGAPQAPSLPSSDDAIHKKDQGGI